MSLVRNWSTWEAVRAGYGAIDRPVLPLYGDHDWSRGEERLATARLVPGAEPPRTTTDIVTMMDGTDPGIRERKGVILKQ